ncbi:hypothetical protein [Micromonospora sp. CPCC 205556]|uniref:hypothetical protein n=1 Tax=Micromonospora sp. CPCC 205556 TaxID=3122398 RepID=UPI002FEFFF99
MAPAAPTSAIGGSMNDARPRLGPVRQVRTDVLDVGYVVLGPADGDLLRGHLIRVVVDSRSVVAIVSLVR